MRSTRWPKGSNVNRPEVLSDEILDKIEELLRGYDASCNSHLYKVFNTTQDQKDIRMVLDKIDYARNGPTDDEIMRDAMEWDPPEKGRPQ